MAEKQNIFISYRRKDSAGYAGRIFDRLAEVYGTQRVFMDIDTIEPGQDFVNAIEKAVKSCEVMIVLMGPSWINVKDESGNRRICNSNDFVHLEIKKALEHKVHVIPVLVGGAVMPSQEELPKDLSDLSRRNAIEITDTRFRYDMGRLVDAIDKKVSLGSRPIAIRSDKKEQITRSSFISKMLALGKEGISALIKGGMVGLLGGIWLWLLGLPWSEEVAIHAQACAYIFEKPLLPHLLRILILVAGSVGGAGISFCLVGGFGLIEYLFPRWSNNKVFLQASALITAGVAMGLGGGAGGAILGLGAYIGTTNFSLGGLVLNIISGAVMGGMLGFIPGVGITLAIILSIALADRMTFIPFRYAILGSLAGFLSGSAILLTTSPALDLLTGLGSILNSHEAQCVFRVWISMVVSGPNRWLGATFVGALLGGVVASHAGKQTHPPQ